MKKLFFLSVVASLIIISCAKRQEVKSPLEGTWKMITGDSKIDTDTSFNTMAKTSQIKMWSRNYWMFVGHYERNDTVLYKGYGGGTYQLDGDRYEEHIMYHNDSTSIGTKYRCLLTIRNDTLYQKCEYDKDWKLKQDNGTEKYVRLE